MASRRLATKVGVVAGVGAVVSAFGVVTPAQAYTCDVTIDPVKADLVTAIDDGNTVICINEGTMNMALEALDQNVPILIDSDLTLVGLGDVIIEGDDDASGFILGWNDGGADINLTIDNLTVQHFHDWNYSGTTYGVSTSIPVVGFAQDTTGTVTILNSRFLSNTTYVSVVGAVDEGGSVSDAYGEIVIDNSVFDGNYTNWGTVWGYSDITVTDSSFVDNFADNTSSAVTQWSSVSTFDGSSGYLSGNYFGDNNGSESTVYFDSPAATIINNTFENNYSDSDWAGPAVATAQNSSVSLAFNTFINNDSSFDVPNVSVDSTASLDIVGNVFSVRDGEFATYSEGVVNDHGGNVSTADDSVNFTNSNSLNSVTAEELALETTADNGGPTLTAALGDGSVALNLVNSADLADFDADLTVDQRGDTRGALLDAGAWDDGQGELAATGVDATGIALTGGLIGAAGVALVTRRRRNA